MTRHPDCECPRTTHHHGHRTTYVVHGCKCVPCRAANRDSERARNRAKVYGRYDRFVDGDLVRAHMRHLMAQGMGWKPIANAAGVATSTVYAILYGKHLDKPDHPEHRPPRIKVERRIADKLMGVGLELQPGAVVPSVGTTRRLQALVAVGWAASELARRIGMAPPNFSPLLHGRRGVLKGTSDAVVALYDALWDQEPPAATATRARRFAARHGWVPPLGWLTDELDDPKAKPLPMDEASVKARARLRHTPRPLEGLAA